VRCHQCDLPLTREELALRACPCCGVAFAFGAAVAPKPAQDSLPDTEWHDAPTERGRAIRQTCWLLGIFAVLGLAFWWFGIRNMEQYNAARLGSEQVALSPSSDLEPKEKEKDQVAAAAIPEAAPAPEMEEQPEVEAATSPQEEAVNAVETPAPVEELAEVDPPPMPAPEPAPAPEPEPEPVQQPEVVEKAEPKPEPKPVPAPPPPAVAEMPAAVVRQVRDLERRQQTLLRSRSQIEREHERKKKDLARKNEVNERKMVSKLESMGNSFKHLTEVERRKKLEDFKSKTTKRNHELYDRNVKRLDDLYSRNTERIADQIEDMQRQMNDLKKRKS